MGWLRPPVGARTARPAVHRIWLIAVGAALYAAALLAEGDGAILLSAAALSALIAAAVANRHLTGVVVVGIGLLLNLMALVLNNGIPVRQSALEEAGVVSPGEVPTITGPHHLETGSDAFGVLGDALPVPLANQVVSFGDLIVVLGAADAARELTRRRSRRWTEPERSAYRLRTAQTSVVQDCGIAPSAAPVSPSQNSAKPEDTAPLVIDIDNDRATSSRRELVAASHRT